MMLADQSAYVALVANDPAAARVLERPFGLPRHALSSAAGPGPVFALGHSPLALLGRVKEALQGDDTANASWTI
jgi:hypothetical protein